MLLADLPREPSLLIRIAREWRPGLSEEQLYERVRRYWRIRPERRDPSPVLAYGIADGIIRAVYRIEGWETYDMAAEAKRWDRLDQSRHPSGERVGFVGRPAENFQHLIGEPLADCPKAQNPVTYSNC
jgi:hypothetical protein